MLVYLGFLGPVHPHPDNAHTTGVEPKQNPLCKQQQLVAAVNASFYGG